MPESTNATPTLLDRVKSLLFYNTPTSLPLRTKKPKRAFTQRELEEMSKREGEKPTQAQNLDDVKPEFRKYAQQNYSGTLRTISDARKYVRGGRSVTTLLFHDMWDTFSSLDSETNELILRNSIHTVVTRGDIVAYDTPYGTAIAEVLDYDELAVLQHRDEIYCKVAVIDKIFK